MKTPEEIKKALLHCARRGLCRECPYGNGSCLDNHEKWDAVEYIQQLENQIGELTEKVAQLEAAQSAAETFRRERDALLADLKEAAKMDCSTCKDYAPEDDRCEKNDFVCRNCSRKDCPCLTCNEASNWQWRGVKTDDEAGD